MTPQNERRASRKAWQQQRNAARRVRWQMKGI